MSTNYPETFSLATVQAGRCSAKEEGKGEKARVLRFALHRLFFFFCQLWLFKNGESEKLSPVIIT